MRLPRQNPISNPASGIALVTVLATLVLIAALVVGFLVAASNSRRSSEAFGRSGEARLLADSALGLALGQLAQATSSETLSSSGETRAWSTQPGLVRVFGGNGSPYQTYKLYSAADMIIDHAGGGGFDPGTPGAPVDVPADWASRPGEFVDLNKRFTIDGANYYPILDPTAAAAGSTVEGFSLGSFSAAPNAEMPVRWLYVLADGAMELPGADGVVPGASRDNKIVGRIAFWTDDESCKINLNTASEGVFWDTPRTAGAEEMKFARFPPFANEWQRVTGHPAMTSLSAVFGSKWPVTRQLAQATYDDNLLAYFGVAPRVDPGGSRAGTVPVDQATFGPILAEPGRLYASIDELLYNDFRGDNPSLGAPGPAAAPQLTATDLERVKFFLTAQSRSPDFNLYNLPRVSMWPQMVLDPSDEAVRDPKERLLAFCSEMGGTTGSRPKYYFQRKDSLSAKKDWDDIPRNQELYKYLQNLTNRPVPGVGQSFATKYGTDGRDQILTEVFDYIRSGPNLIDSMKAVRNKTIIYPTDFSFVATMPSAGQVVPIEIDAPGSGATETRGFGRYPTVAGVSLVFYYIGAKQNLTSPADPGYDWMNLDMAGKTWTASGRVPFNPASPPTGMNPPIAANKDTRIGATLIVHLFMPSEGLAPYRVHLGYQVDGLDGITVSDTLGPVTTAFPSTAKTVIDQGESLGGYMDWFLASFMTQSKQGGFDFNQHKFLRASSGDPFGSYPFVAAGAGIFKGPDDIEYPYMDIKGPTFSFSGASLTIKILPIKYSDPSASSGRFVPSNASLQTDPVQTIRLNIPGASGLPVPTPAFYTATEGSPAKSKGFYAPLAFRVFPNGHPYKARITAADNEKFKSFSYRGGDITPGDVVRSVVLDPGTAGGDIRTVAGLRDVPTQFYTAAPGYASGVGIRDGGITREDAPPYEKMSVPTLENGLGGTLVSGIKYYTEANPLTVTATSFKPRSATSGYPLVPGSRTLLNNTETFFREALNKSGKPGDWDNGRGNMPDGPYLNKPDEGYDKGLGSSSGTIATNPYPAYYRGLTQQDAVAGKSFSPNRQIASPVALGSLPSRISPSSPATSGGWETLLFAPNPSAGFDSAAHRGFVEPKDHYLLDLFTMPIVEPYAISEPFSTAGRVNMNYRMAPFTYLRRATGLHAVLKPLRISAIPDDKATEYSRIVTPESATGVYRRDFDPAAIDQTLLQFEQKFDSTGRFNDAKHAFLSASEICELFLVPKGETLANVSSPTGFWSTNRLTGDNSREFPYNDLYPRLTTRSNTFTVHVCTQAVQQRAGSDPTNWTKWREGTDGVEAEWRGSFTIERYIPEGDTTQVVPDFAVNPASSSESLAGKYRVRVLRSQQFSP